MTFNVITTRPQQVVMDEKHLQGSPRFVIGDVKRGPGYGEGFARTLKPDQQLSIVMYLNYRGLLRYFNNTGATAVARGAFRIT